MIVKYRLNGGWCFIDGVTQAHSKEFDPDVMQAKYDKDAELRNRVGFTEATDQEGQDYINVQKTYFAAFSEMCNDYHGTKRGVNAICGNEMKFHNSSVVGVLLHTDKSDDVDHIVIITNQPCFLMNDQGQTIERLV